MESERESSYYQSSLQSKRTSQRTQEKVQEAPKVKTVTKNVDKNDKKLIQRGKESSNRFKITTSDQRKRSIVSQPKSRGQPSVGTVIVHEELPLPNRSQRT